MRGKFLVTLALVTMAGCSESQPVPNGADTLNESELIRLENNGYDTKVLRETNRVDPTR